MTAVLKGWEVVFMTLEEMKAIDPRTVDRRSLVQIGSVRTDKNLSQTERYRRFLEQIGNPYCYLDGKTVVKISFANTRRTLADCVQSYLGGL